MLIAIDPGKTTGWAFFCQKKLVKCGVTKGSPPALPALGLTTFEAIIEKPQTYPMSPVDSNDLITLGILVGEWKEYLYRHGAKVELVLPTTWKGAVPKPIHGKRVLASLLKEEKAVLPKAKKHDHNMIDAVGLGLWKLERTRR